MNIFRNSILSCAMILGIFSNDVDAQNWHCVNNKAFKHTVQVGNNDEIIEFNVPRKKIYIKNNNNRLVERDLQNYNFFDDNTISYQACSDDYDEYNYPEYNCRYFPMPLNHNPQPPYAERDAELKDNFNKIYRNKITNGIIGDAKVAFGKEVSRIFGKSYKFMENWRFEFEAQFPYRRKFLPKQDGGSKYFTVGWKGDFDSLAKRNGFQLVTNIKHYRWQGTVTDNNGQVKQFNIYGYYSILFRNIRRNIVIANEENAICYNAIKNELRIYHRPESGMDVLNYDDAIEKFNKLGLFLQEKFKAEERTVKTEFGQNYTLDYVD